MVSVESKDLPNEAGRWLDEAQSQIVSLRALISEYERLRVIAKSSEEENDRLRGIVVEHEKLRGQLETSERLRLDLQGEVDRLRADTHRYREREEVSDSLTTILSEFLVRLRPRLAISAAGDDGPLTSRFEQALLAATRLHARRARTGTQTPYVVHPLSAAALVLEGGGDEDEAIAALLHEAVGVEGSLTTLDDVRHGFGERVAGIVEACADSAEPATVPWRERKERLLARLRQAPPEALRVSAANALHDARVFQADRRATGDAAWSRLGVTREDLGWYYRSLVGLLRQRGPAFFADELARVVEDLAANSTRAAQPPASPPGAAARSMFGLLKATSIGGGILAVAILVWVLIQSAVGTWWTLVRPILSP